MKDLFFHCLFTLLWISVTGSYTGLNLLAGFAIGYALLWMFQIPFNSVAYVRRVAAGALFFFRFIWIFLKANWQVVRIIVGTDRNTIKGSFIELPVADMTPLEIAILGQCITLTPGTVTARYDPRRHTLLVHCLNAPDSNAVIKEIEHDLKAPILRFTR